MTKHFIYHYGSYQKAWERNGLVQLGPKLTNSDTSIRTLSFDLKTVADQLADYGIGQSPIFYYTDNFYLRKYPLRNLRCWTAPLILVCGDLHHGEHPLATLQSYLQTEHCDAVLLLCNATMLPSVRRFTSSPVRFLPPSFFKYSASARSKQPKNILAHVGSIGKYHTFRRSVVESLLTIPHLRFEHYQTKTPEEASVIYANSALVLNVPLNNDLNHRIYECMASGAPQIVLGSPELLGDQELLALRQDLIWVSSIEEVVEKAVDLLDSQNKTLSSIDVPPPPCWDLDRLLRAALAPYKTML